MWMLQDMLWLLASLVSESLELVDCYLRWQIEFYNGDVKVMLGMEGFFWIIQVGPLSLQESI